MRLPHPRWPHRLSTATVLWLARVGPCGRARRAPGTWGSVAGMGYFALLTAIFRPLESCEILLLSALGIWFAIGLCGEAELRLGKRDPGEVVLDEFVVMPLCFLGWTTLTTGWSPWVVGLAGFALFRLFDITKPLGIAKLQDLRGGWGVVVDDVAAALAACATLHLAHYLAHGG